MGTNPIFSMVHISLWNFLPDFSRYWLYLVARPLATAFIGYPFVLFSSQISMLQALVQKQCEERENFYKSAFYNRVE